MGFSVVALHGLNGHAFESYAHNGENKTCMWLRDLLPSLLPHSRIMVFGYNANVWKNPGVALIEDFANSLVSELAGKRITTAVSPWF
jgi:hypothetical protein